MVVRTPDKLDILFVVDDSEGMLEPQRKLREQLPHLIDVLTSGRHPDGSRFLPFRDLHLGVVSANLGASSRNDVEECVGFGDDGVMNDVPDRNVAGCPRDPYPNRFLEFQADGGMPPRRVASDLACLASLGADGCGYQQPLEAGLKALWPAIDIDPETGMQWVDPITDAPSNRFMFLGDGTGAGIWGHGDLENAGFIRNDRAEGLSLIAVVIVTNEEDCSSSTTDHFVSGRDLPPGSRYVGQGQRLRCFFNTATHLYDVKRYIDGYKALRPRDYQDLVFFAAIAGVPADLVEPEDIEGIFDDDDARATFYREIMNDPRMQEVIDPVTQADGDIDTDFVVPSCLEVDLKAYPPPRLVEVAEGFGRNGVVQSICEESFEPAIDAIAGLISRNQTPRCLPGPLHRGPDGRTACDVIWDTSLSEPIPSPDECPGAHPQRCTLKQLAVADGRPESGSGWFYDDFSDDTKQLCPNNPWRIKFTPGYGPPPGKTVRLECSWLEGKGLGAGCQ